MKPWNLELFQLLRQRRHVVLQHVGISSGVATKLFAREELWDEGRKKSKVVLYWSVLDGPIKTCHTCLGGDVAPSCADFTEFAGRLARAEKKFTSSDELSTTATNPKWDSRDAEIPRHRLLGQCKVKTTILFLSLLFIETNCCEGYFTLVNTFVCVLASAFVCKEMSVVFSGHFPWISGK